MPKVKFFNGQRVVEPGAYSQIKSALPVPIDAVSTGNVAIIDTGSGAGWVGGAGISGQWKSKKDAVYEFTDKDAFKAFVGGGMYYELADILFNPSNNGAGVPKLFLVKAAVTTPAEIVAVFQSVATLNALTALTISGTMPQPATSIVYSMSNTAVTTASGIFTDSGGVSSNYGNNETFIKTFTTSNPGSPLQFNFIEFAVEQSYEKLYVYDGADTNSPLIGVFTGTQNPGIIKGTGNSITFKFISDSSNVTSGWRAEISTPGIGGQNTLPSNVYYVSPVAGTYVEKAMYKVTVVLGTITSIEAYKQGKYSVVPPSQTSLEFRLSPTDTSPLQTLTITNTQTYTALPAGGGRMAIKTLDEGLGANGVFATAGGLSKGYAMKVVADTDNPDAFVFTFYRGTYKGKDIDNVDIDGIDEATATKTPQVITQSPALANIADFQAWALADFSFNQYFRISDITVTGTGAFINSMISGYTDYILAVDATEAYNPTAYDVALASLDTLDNTFFLSDRYGDNAKSTYNSKLLTFILNTSEFKKFIFIGGGKDDTKLLGTNGSYDITQTYNSPYVYVWHSDVYISNTVGKNVRRNTMYHAAYWIARAAGVEPQTPITWKDVSIKGVVHELSKKERETALLKGLAHVREIADGVFVCNQAINTLQKNDALIINADAYSPELSVMRIEAQINREITIACRNKFTGQDRVTISPADVETFISGLLASKRGTLIIDYSDIKVERVDGDWNIRYGMDVNGPTNRTFITGYITGI